ncbi:transglutaminase family protein [uncultured Piscinibacter sp.]|uniref:transglutaminase family protein n=1 Tax=uncultured Piscinibacter sp. TaxID=1131835 RepID=UPI002633C1DE|nr:transglutaminase family protein [uncultured Piscinibacter sp.]
MDPVRYDIVHTTVYRYREPVLFGEHRVMFRPRDSHDLRVLATDLRVSPQASVRLIQDPHSNSIAIVQPLEAGAELRIVCSFTIEHAHSHNLELPIAPAAEFFPFAYSVEERFDLEHYLRPHHDDPQGRLTAWARQFIRTDGPTATRDLLVQMNQHIRDTFTYQARDEEGTQDPLQTLDKGSGSCRDFALLMMEAARRLGVATRFVSGYLYDPALDEAGGEASAMVGAGSTHAWLQAYLPGAGWVPFDPTNNLLGGNTLIRVGVARDPTQAAPVSGSWFGPADAYLGLQATVQVRRQRGDT